jgi:hypothetical protein
MRRLAFLSTVALLFAGTVTGGATATAGPATGLQRVKGTTLTTNWAGYVAFGETFTDVKGTWVQPTANCSHGRAIAAFWVGLDGWDSSTVEQTGTEAACLGPTPFYFAWYEFYPAGPVALDSITYPVVPGDTITAEVKHVGSNVTITINSDAWQAPFSASISDIGLDLSSAEWIAEGPTRNLTDFGTVGFTSATASTDTATYVNYPINSLNWAHEDITMVLQRGPFLTTRASTSTLGAGGDSFTVTWQHS